MISPFEFKSTHYLAVSVALFAVLFAAIFVLPDSQAATAASQPLLVMAPVPQAPGDQESDGVSAEDRYHTALLKGRDLAKQWRSLSLRFFDGSLAESRQWKDKWPELAKELAEHRPVLEQAAIDWFIEAKNPDDDLLRLVSAISAQTYDTGDLETTWNLLQKLKNFFPEENDMELQCRISLVAIKTNRFDYALDFLRRPGAKDAVDALGQLDKNMFLLCPIMARKWQREEELRQKELEADDLPRVKIQLSTGEVIFELFENEAPQVVANFINLVESGYYDDSYCHPHVKNIVVQSGMQNRNFNVPIDYMIKNESRSEDARDHFNGSLTMASLSSELTAPTAFAVTLSPNPELDWDRTEKDKISQPVFGRVVSGMKHVMALPVTMEIDEETQEQSEIKDVTPGYIEKATIIRKRDHEYTYEKIRRPQEKK